MAIIKRQILEIVAEFNRINEVMSEDRKCRLTTMSRLEYGNTKEWRSKRKLLIEAFRGKCSTCRHAGVLEAHHNTYDRYGYEEFTDLVPLCSSCHKLFAKVNPSFNRRSLPKSRSAEEARQDAIDVAIIGDVE